MKRFVTIAAVTVVILVTFLGLIRYKMRSERPELLLDALRRGEGDSDELKMRLNPT